MWIKQASITLLLLLTLMAIFATRAKAWLDCDDLQTSRLRVRAAGVRNGRLLLLTDTGIFDEDMKDSWNPHELSLTLGISGWVWFKWPIHFPNNYSTADDSAFIRDRDEDWLVLTWWHNTKKQVFFNLDRKTMNYEEWQFSSDLQHIRYNFASNLEPNQSAVYGIAEALNSNGLCLYRLKAMKSYHNSDYHRNKPENCAVEQLPFGYQRALLYKDFLIVFKTYNVTVLNRTTMKIIAFRTPFEFFNCRFYTFFLLFIGTIISIVILGFGAFIIFNYLTTPQIKSFGVGVGGGRGVGVLGPSPKRQSASPRVRIQPLSPMKRISPTGGAGAGAGAGGGGGGAAPPGDAINRNIIDNSDSKSYNVRANSNRMMAENQAPLPPPQQNLQPQPKQQRFYVSPSGTRYNSNRFKSPPSSSSSSSSSPSSPSNQKKQTILSSSSGGGGRKENANENTENSQSQSISTK